MPRNTQDTGPLGTFVANHSDCEKNIGQEQGDAMPVGERADQLWRHTNGAQIYPLSQKEYPGQRHSYLSVPDDYEEYRKWHG